MGGCSHPDEKKKIKMRKVNGQYLFRTACECGHWHDSYWHLGDAGKTKP
jgi:hypothetical protein